MDKKGSHDLFGPVNKIYCASYDRAMALYLACLRVRLVPHTASVSQHQAFCPAALWATRLLICAPQDLNYIPSLALRLRLSLIWDTLGFACLYALP